MGKAQREKGKRFEQAVAKDLRKIFGEKVGRGWQARSGIDAPDVVGTPFWIECKHHKKVNIRAALLQAVNDSNVHNESMLPIAVCKDDKCDSIVALLWDDFLKLLTLWKAT